MKGRIQRVALYGKLTVGGNERLPGQGQNTLEQRLEIRRGKGPQFHQDPCAASQIDIEPGDIGKGALAVDAAVFCPDAPQIQPPHFVGHQSLQAQQTGDGEYHMDLLKRIPKRKRRRFASAAP